MHVFLTGASGFLGSVCLAACVQQKTVSITTLRSGARSTPVCAPVPEVLWSPPYSIEALETALDGTRPSHIVHVGALSSAERCEQEPEEAYRSNVLMTEILIACALRWRAHLTFVSTDLVFDGMTAPEGGLREDVAPHPVSQYGRTKHEAERLVLRHPDSAVVRLSLLYGRSPAGPGGVLAWMEESFAAGRDLVLFEDEFRTPIHVSDATRVLLMIAEQRLTGVWHCGGPERLSRVEFGRAVAKALGYNPGLTQPALRASYSGVPRRPEDVSLDSRKLWSVLGVELLGVEATLGK